MDTKEIEKMYIQACQPKYAKIEKESTLEKLIA